jgi:hypothetical protein
MRLLSTILLLVPLAAARGESVDVLPLPEPAGEFRIGLESFLWLDESREEAATEDPGDHRLLPVHIWYPADSDGTGSRAPYLGDLDPFREAWGPRTLGLVERVRTNSFLGASVSKQRERYPVVLFSHGWGELAYSHSILLEALASHGYVVVGIDHPYMGAVALPGSGVTEPTEDHFAGTEQIRAFYGADVRFVLDQLTALDQGAGRLAGRLDLEAVAAIGHSSGFVAVSAACIGDTRILACVNYDAPGFASEELIGLQQPLLWVRADRADSPPAEFLDQLAAPVYDIQIDGGRHDSFTDWPYLKAEGEEARQLAERQMSQVESYTLGFLDLHLRARLHQPH